MLSKSWLAKNNLLGTSDVGSSANRTQTHTRNSISACEKILL